MSECVLRMEFRKNCLDCDMHQIVYGDSYADTDVYCFKEKRFVGKRFGPTKDLARPSWCPILCQLPEGHGRLVDADALADDVRSLWDYKTVDGITATTVLNQTLTDIRNCPTIVPAEAERSEE